MSSRPVATHPLELPELLQSLGEWLPHKEILSCCLVSHVFNSAFTPFLWRHLHLRKFHNHRGPLKLLKANADSVRILETDTLGLFDSSQTPLTYFTNLECLILNEPLGEDDNLGEDKAYNRYLSRDPNLSTFWAQIGQMVGRNPRLKRVNINNEYFCPQLAFWKPLAENCTELCELRLWCVETLETAAVPHFLKILQRLQALRMQGFDIVNGALMKELRANSNQLFTNLKSLHIFNLERMHGEDRLNLVRRCPNLTHLGLCLPSEYQDPDTIKPAISSKNLIKLMELGTWKHLDSIDIDNLLHRNDYTDAYLSILISKVPTAWKEVFFRRSLFGPQAFRQLTQECNLRVLRVVDVKESSGVTSAMIQQLLTKCPELTTLAATKLHVKDIKQPWVCTKLRSLSIIVHGLEDGSQEKQNLYYDRLSSLAQLEELVLGYGYLMPRENLKQLKLHLDHGLQKLASLKHLRLLTFCGSQQSMRREEVVWMIRHLRNLQEVSGSLHSADFTKEKALKVMFEQNNIKVILPKVIRGYPGEF
ncbi:hypothetical protein BGX28_007764 [Mortierella sp. GBA30]|nr:hypothetical protein BGX28_007764 [Mortierella sp. GBA30]